MPQYQTFADRKGHSDSAAKLAALRLPLRLGGKSVLDIGCNEGFFCQEARRRGAERVVGIDRSADAIEQARARDPECEFRVMDWSELPALGETFDVVLLLSALHYAGNPSHVLQLAFDRVSENGILLLECGVADGRAPEWVPVKRPRGDTVLHPTRAMVRTAIPGSVVRPIGPSVSQGGDPVPRAVFRFTRQRPVVLLVHGPPGSGKSTLAQALCSQTEHAAVGLDHLIATLGKWTADPTLSAIAAGTGPGQIPELARRIAAEAPEEFVEAVLLRREDALTKPVTVIEGYILGCGDMAAMFARRLSEANVFVWEVEPSSVRPRLLGGVREAGMMPLPPQGLRFMREDDQQFLATGNVIVDDLENLCVLQPDSSVLDIGSGYGRVAHALWRRGYRGDYLGLDIMRDQVQWCREKLTPASHGHMQFEHLDVRNDRYNPNGAVSPTEVTFDRYADVMVLASVFTHMWPDEVRHYLREVRRWLTGRAFATFFCLDGDWQPPMPHDVEPGCRYGDATEPLRRIGYSLRWIHEAADSAGLTVYAASLGSWCGRPAGRRHQDAFIFE